MQLWHVERTDPVDWEEHLSAVIRAESEDDARRIAAEKLTPTDKWASKNVKCKPLMESGSPGVILEWINWG